MAAPSSASNPSAWQAALDPRLTRRLMRPLQRPGIIGTRLARSVVSRLERMAGGFPLLPKLSQRWSSPESSAAGQRPIVYAQPALPAAGRWTVDDGPTKDEGRRTNDESHHPSSHVARSGPAKSQVPFRGRSSVAQREPSSSVTPSNPPASAAQRVPLSSIARPAKRSTVARSGPPSPVAQSDPPPSLGQSIPSSPEVEDTPLKGTYGLQGADLRRAKRSSVARSGPLSAGGNVVQRKSISTISPSISPSISKQTAEMVQRQVEGTSPQSMTFASPSLAASPESSAPLPVVHPHVDGLPERFREPPLNLVSPALAQPQRERVVVRPLPSASNESHVVQRAVHPPSLTASTPEVSFIDSPMPARPVSAPSAPSWSASARAGDKDAPAAPADHSSPRSGSGAQPIAPLVVSHPSSAPSVIQRQAAPTEQKTQSSVVQRVPRRGGSGGGGTDIDELAEKVQAKLAHWLTIESERRGLTRWD